MKESLFKRVTLAHSIHISPSALQTLRAGSFDQRAHSFGQKKGSELKYSPRYAFHLVALYVCI